MSGLNTDLSERAVAFIDGMDWQQSPAAGVWRKRLYHDGPAESGRVTSIVRFEAGSQFPTHDHPDGEEILILSGTFSDDTGDWGPGSYLLNPVGTPHAPESAEGCELFVHLRQYRGSDKLRIDTHAEEWQPGRLTGVEQMILHDDPNGPDGPETMRMVRLAAGVTVPEHPHPLGEEALLIEGDLEDDLGRYGPGCWVRNPPGSSHWARTENGCLLYVGNGGLGLAVG